GVLLKTGNAERKLEALIGLAPIKDSIKKIKAYALANKDSAGLNLHMCFLGNPGTGKTETARIIAEILHENGLLPTDKVIETDRGGLVAGYVGQTAIKTAELIEEVMGGVLFIDEAYSLVPKDTPGDYGHEAIAELIKQMEDKRGQFCVIFAGYKNPMQEMLSSNQGLRSRIQFTLDFPNYSREELQKITELMLRQRKYSISERALARILDITDIKRKAPDFANAREVRNILEQVIMCQNLRCVGTEDRTLDVVDVNKYISDNNIALPTSGDGAVKKILTADEELDALVRLANVKRMVKKIRAYAKRNKAESDFNIHMSFCGNPGTGKTETARILSRILYETDVLPEAKLIETDAHGLMGKFVGETAPKTLAKINEAMGGVLFIDEAYALTESSTTDGKSTTYGDEAIAVLLKEMEDRRGQFCVILAGYTDEMKAMIGSNPGLASRVQFTLDFPDFTREELSEIALGMLEKKKYTIAYNALSLMLDVCEYYRRQPDFANARTVRNLLDQVILNQNLRADE
nr:AAA family ATPase [Ruminococcus sp.]